ncbi:uncharacterized protein LOC6593831 isoform X1 [Drosophila persimilis]|uniref:uncharacterized protein LOC6593831 isoform X1 n=1 Tax=Drosophila persimilis TaxID=7234 RepID=UPI000F095827|nr:uncharacterized protein LOC6593831 isoform X1 [Drosophila persimilis]
MFSWLDCGYHWLLHMLRALAMMPLLQKEPVIDGGIVGSRPWEIMSAMPRSYTVESNAGLQHRDAGLMYPTLCHKPSRIRFTSARRRPIQSIPRRIRDRQRSIPDQWYPSTTEAHSWQDLNLTSHHHPSTWPSTARTLTMATKGGATRTTRI